jgi:hypothetical protein
MHLNRLMELRPFDNRRFTLRKLGDSDEESSSEEETEEEE